jgi:hypothetical protein
MKSNIFIPKRINVGYQNRSDTYTKKLAYVIYYDEKGKLRKETSWNSWRDDKIEPQEFDNEPTSGFVLNKKVGDYDSGWNHRHAYVRIYDPRNFEFEITIENLLYILENTSAIKGKGLEGDFVYGWDGKDLVLIPTESPDYRSINEYNNILHNNETIKAKDLIIGATYLTKDNHEMIYIGKYDYFSSGYKWIENGEYKTSKSRKDIPTEQGRYGRRAVDYKYINNYPYGKYFWFAYKHFDYDYINGERVNKLDYKWSFNQYPSISGKFLKCTDDKCTSYYSEIFEIMEGNSDYSPYDESKDVFCEITLDDFIKLGKREYADRPDYYGSFKFISTISVGKETYLAEPVRTEVGKYILQDYRRKDEDRNSYGYKVGFVDNIEIFPTQKETIKSYGYNSQREITKMIPVSLEEIYEKMKPLCIQQFLKNGRTYKKEYSL